MLQQLFIHNNNSSFIAYLNPLITETGPRYLKTLYVTLSDREAPQIMPSQELYGQKRIKNKINTKVIFYKPGILVKILSGITTKS